MISRPYKVAYYVNAQGKDCGWFGENCNIGDDILSVFTPQTATAPLAPKGGPIVRTVGLNMGSNPSIGASGGEARGISYPSMTTGSSIGGAGGGMGTMASGIQGKLQQINLPTEVDQIMAQIDQTFQGFGLPQGVGVPIVAVGGGLALIWLLTQL